MTTTQNDAQPRGIAQQGEHIGQGLALVRTELSGQIAYS